MLTSYVPQRSSSPAAVGDPMAPWTPVLTCWLLIGGVALVCVPELRGFDPLVGWLPFWFVIAPALDLAALHRRRLIAAALAVYARMSRRRRKARQAQPLQRRSRMPRRARPLVRSGRVLRAMS